MHVPTAEELAAIAVAYLAVTRREEPPALREISPWRLAGRLDSSDLRSVRGAVPSGSRWRMAGRLDG
jgi:hypothetical protein